MDRKLDGTRSPRLAQTSTRRSAFEMALNLEFQAGASSKVTTIPKAGDPCPQCQSTKIDYDGMLNLSCSDCGYTLAGCFT